MIAEKCKQENDRKRFRDFHGKYMVERQKHKADNKRLRKQLEKYEEIEITDVPVKEPEREPDRTSTESDTEDNMEAFMCNICYESVITRYPYRKGNSSKDSKI